ncbi:hypothetical protein RC083_07050 [Pseudoalteromonas haloplanktis]|uniref:Uncharacterized protein n=1 Tax=Pseudoalteromonas haloplanktis TaxID=228 RepID=A0ABU1BBN8_PSEHA|nr:hypothetical protein [Pseudoalteromonas haloplanktis]MDQ9091344.1 hypothetical protein [Pseudoalteromonas haloplanktis]
MKYSFIILSLLLTGCVTTHNPIPEGYTGPLSTIDDSFTISSSQTAGMFYIQKVNGKDVVNAYTRSYSASSGQNGALVTLGHSHKLPAIKTKLLLSGEIMHGAPIGYLFNSDANYVVSGEIEFLPEENKHYLVSGELSKKRSAVWIEDINGDIVSQVVVLLEGNTTSSIESTNQLIDENISSVKKDKPALFSSIKGGESLDLVLAKIGEPDSIVYDKGNFFTMRRSHIEYVYNELGKIKFTERDKKAGYVLRVFPNLLDGSKQLTNQLESSGLTLQHVAKEYYKRDDISELELDKIASAIWVNRNKEDSYTIDAVAWLIKVIGKQGNNRYYSLLNTLNNKNEYDSKIVRYAKSNLEQLEPSSVNQFSYVDQTIKSDETDEKV